MDLITFTDKISSLAGRVKELTGHINTEESTKASLINPFLQALGYDISDPRSICYEFTTDVGTKKGEKVDYAIKKNDKIVMLIEAKKVGTPLDASKVNQLHRYFHNTAARIAILTNGVIYEFYSDLDKDNIMDSKPFMIFDFENVDEKLIPELKKLANDDFDVDIALLAAQDLKHTRHIKAILDNELKDPSDDFVRFFASQITGKPLRANILDDFRGKVKNAFVQYINEEIINRVQNSMLKPSTELTVEDEAPIEEDSNKIITTEEEIEAYMIVKSILRKTVPLSRVIMRDTMSYCGVLLDDNNRKPICRFYFNSSKVKYLATFNENREEQKHKIESVDDIFNFNDILVKTAKHYDNV